MHHISDFASAVRWEH